MSKSPTGKMKQLALPRAKAAAPAKSTDDAARLLVDAESFLRLGLYDKAIEHLAGAVGRDPSLRALREPLVKLYVTQRQYKNAIAELWALLSPCDNPQDEIRFLRYILRLGDKDPAAEQRLQAILSQVQHEAPSKSAEADDAALSPGDVDRELRAYLGDHRPPTDHAPTRDFSNQQSPEDPSEVQLPPSAATRRSTAEVEAVAEEMALNSGALKVELRAIDAFLEQGRHDDALGRLLALTVRYPHSKRVQARLQQLEQSQVAKTTGKLSPISLAGKKESYPDLHSAATLPPDPSSLQTDQGPPKPKPSVPTKAPKSALLQRHTLEVTPEDIQEERPVPAVEPPRRAPPPPPKAGKVKAAAVVSEAARAFRTGTTMRSFGQHQQAIAIFEKLRDDPQYGAAAALNAGRSYRDLHRPYEAIKSFMRGIKLPQASDAEVNELFYELGRSYELIPNAGEAILYYQLSLGTTGSFRDAAERIALLQQALLLA